MRVKPLSLQKAVFVLQNLILAELLCQVNFFINIHRSRILYYI
jgi:hypothetical protein